ncbi:TetR/AcrR family transcriptional regulator [Streptomyces litchfieldiae]|uniref:TetR/AcrR family transcriptional regulator n=1 Tax=Streptomyces litchfieldiae TaxID=3075543 RepID=A0ABU2MRP7_9ACTN|nr:TetR/AcrR family transcriptional regulator [Streptomyces sp. DSM 44938]MDT0344302.1 TetR/AcrR family transcriptional regulator [Streptomyces sp. DSM 44938]
MAHEARPRRKRQARGEQRMAQILDAAATVFAEHGYEAATTIKISAEAGISPGSLYQFFPNKEAIAEALALRFVADLGAAHDEAFSGVDLAGLGLDEFIDRIVDPLIAFNIANPGFKALFARTDQPAGLSSAAEPLERAVMGRVVGVVVERAGRLTPAEATLAAHVGGQVFKALIPMVVAAAEGGEREAVIGELKKVLRGYFGQVLDP